MMNHSLAWLTCLFIAFSSDAARAGNADPRYKTDLLLVVAHPDDETAVSGYLARTIFDQHKRIAVVYSVSAGPAREIEARRALATYGVQEVWFIGSGGNGSQDVLRSIGDGRYPGMLEDLVRIIRLTQAEVVLTWIPALVGDHGEHQAAGVLATEAFNTAGDAGAYPAQLSLPRNDADVFKNGLEPWQPKKLYFFTDASTVETTGRGPSYRLSDVSAARGRTYLKLALEEAVEYRSDPAIGPAAAEALKIMASGRPPQLKTHGFELFPDPERLIRGKSLVGGTLTGDVFENISPNRIDFMPPHRPVSLGRPDLAFELGGPWDFYRRFWRTQEIDLNDEWIPTEIGIAPGRTLFVPLVLRNDTDTAVEVTLSASLGPGWDEDRNQSRYQVPAHGSTAIRSFVSTPAKENSMPVDLRWQAQFGGRLIGSVELRTYLLPWRLPQ
jgi:LmbE family N-acetylglucosaminyl deacetylase